MIMERIYISAPITGQEETAEARFRDAESLLRSEGYEPVNPYERNKGYAKWEDAVLADLRLLKGCDGIMLCKGWRMSRGCEIERLFARGMGKEIIFEEMLVLERGGPN